MAEVQHSGMPAQGGWILTPHVDWPSRERMGHYDKPNERL